MIHLPPSSTLFPYTTLFRSLALREVGVEIVLVADLRPQQSRTCRRQVRDCCGRSEEHTSELQSQSNLVCRLLLEKKNKHRTEGSERAPLLQYFTSTVPAVVD